MTSTIPPRTQPQTAVVLLALGGLLLTAACTTEDSPQDADSPVTEETPDEGAAADETAVLTMAEVEENDAPESCWAVRDGTVYDLTEWIDEHPGGAARIEQLCGTDATDAFDAQHGGQDGPEGQLSEFEIGALED